MEEKKKKFIIRISEKELKNPHIRAVAIKLIDTKIREQRSEPRIEISKSEYEIIKTHLGHFFTDWTKYVKNKKELKFKTEVGKYNGKRVIIK